jgi:Putative transposase
MAKAFRGKFLDALRAAFAAGGLRFPGQLKNVSTPRGFATLLRQCCRHKWVVYAKRPFGGPEHVLKYLGSYTHRIAISNHRLIELKEGKISFRWRDSAHKNKKRILTLQVEEFLRRFFLHVLPDGFVRIRHFGFMANRQRQHRLAICRRLLNALQPILNNESAGAPSSTDFWCCPTCGGTMIILERFTAIQMYVRPPPLNREIA